MTSTCRRGSAQVEGQAPPQLLYPGLSYAKLFFTRKELHIRSVIRHHIDKVIQADEFVMQNFLDVATCVAHYVIEEM